ncbi:NAD(P)-binding protein [Cucurbitaria berberidis CBS 394.84]|uniref:NAD(P)-binding protein n=1 Tax=Cucurbitaria berberidis CBS 394.84 TaxID=1168544 RepID=A0A9P4L6S0_9PLEO|nr:NAD(P)-binding protein [Cucurbitaria berberidis CBS 394.84]KAF1843368.1 NAD(P)-binding protein [Cucurbitaria berberidis CBS 394.84]
MTYTLYPVELESRTSTRPPRKRTTSSQSVNFSRPNRTSPTPPQSSQTTAPRINIQIQAPTPTTALPAPHSKAKRTTHKLKMRTYFLTGANRGIGLEFVRQLSSNPHTTVIAGVRSKSNDISTLEALNTNSNVHIIECDVSSPDSLSSLSFRVAEILSQTGANLDYLFNIAGINATSADTSLSLDAESLQRHMQINVLGPAKIVQSLRGYLARGAVVMNMTSGLGSLTVATDVTKCCTYSMSKAALNMLTLHQAKDLKGAGVKVLCMDPGWVKTRMGGKGAMIEAQVSVESMLGVVAGLKDGDSGKFYRYDGGVIPW